MVTQTENRSEHPSYLPESIEAPERAVIEEGFWSMNPKLRLEEDSAEELRRSMQIVDALYEDPTLRDMGLDPSLPGTESNRGHGTRVAVDALLANDQLKRENRYHLVGNTRVLTTAALLHDIGKLEPKVNEVVMFDGKIPKGRNQDMGDAVAWTVIKRHPRIGFNVAMNMFGLDDSERARVAWAINCHHEKQDGKGYYKIPRNRISPESQIISVADAFDVMNGNRPYKMPSSTDASFRELRRCTRQFNQEIVEAFANVRPPGEDLIFYHNR